MASYSWFICMLLQVTILCLAVAENNRSSSSLSKEGNTERDALLSTGWWGNEIPSNLSHCNWKGVGCNSEKRVTIVDPGRTYTGDKLEKLNFSSFPYLKRLRLPNCGLHGSIPYQIGVLSNLKELDLNNNSLTGNLPSSLINLTQLDSVDVSNNFLSGSIPSGLIGSSPKNLTVLSLSNCKLNGSIPDQIGMLSTLQFLLINNNNLTGNIPSSILNQLSLMLQVWPATVLKVSSKRRMCFKFLRNSRERIFWW